MKKNLQYNIVSGRWTLPICLILSIACWITSGAAGWWTLAFYALTGYLLMLLINAHGLIRKNSHMPPVCFLLLISVYTPLQQFRIEYLSLFCWWLALYAVMQSYRKSYPMAGLFYAGLALGTGSLLLPVLSWFLPVWWMGAVWFRSLTLRSCSASLIGLMLPYWLLFAVAWCTDNMPLFNQKIESLMQVETWQMPSLGAWAMLLMLFLMQVISTVHCKLSRHEEKQSTRAYLNFLALTSMLTTLVMLVQPVLINLLLPHAIFVTSILGGHFLALSRGKSAHAFFIFLLIAYSLLLTLHFTAWKV